MSSLGAPGILISFITIAANLIKNLPQTISIFCTQSEKFKSFYQNINITPGHFKLQPRSIEQDYHEFHSLNPQKSTGLDNIAPRFLEDGVQLLAPIVGPIIKLSITNNHVPDDLKHAKVTPLFKKKDKLEVSNYSPISVLILNNNLSGERA